MKDTFTAVKKKDKKINVRVYRLDGDAEERKMEIFVGGNHPEDMATFHPGQEIGLNKTQLNILKSQVVCEDIPIPLNSGIYQQSNPELAASTAYPSHTYSEDPNTGRIVMKKRTPRYAVEYV